MSNAVGTIEHSETTSQPNAARPATSAAPASSKPEVLVPARFDEIEAIHDMVMEAINTSPYYNDDFKAHESARLTPAFLDALVHADPRHIMTIRENGELAGFMLSGPEYGILWQYWNYIEPSHRSGTLAMRAMRNYLPLWENDRFHKILTYSRPENRVSIALMERYRYKLVAELKEHMFGEDYLLYEYKLNKTRPGYDSGIGVGALASMRYRLERLLPFRRG